MSRSSNRTMPVPAGMSRPMITFSFRPFNRSTAPWMLASVSTLVVSWKEAAETQLSVLSEALVIPRINALRRGLSALGDHGLVGLFELQPVHLLFEDEIRVAHVHHLHPAHHLAHNDFDVLVVDAHPLQAVDFLDFIHQVFGQGHLALDLENVLGDGGAADQRFAGAHVIALVDVDVLARGIRYSFLSPTSTA